MSKLITIIGGRDKSGNVEAVKSLQIESGEIYSIVGFTGSGKSQLISDIEQMAQGDTVTGRQILIDGKAPDYSTRYNPDLKLVAQLSQNMNFALEMEVRDFLILHAESRGIVSTEKMISEIMACVNSLAGEAVMESDILTRLSGGQSRALMIADVAIISNSPIILVDEIENAGIDRRKAMKLLTGRGKIVLIVTHDPQLALIGEKRIVMKNGGMDKIIDLTKDEKLAEAVLDQFTTAILNTQNKIRSGENITKADLVLREAVLC
ncbi:MAG: ATP-binding cassette domain-containing protein [Spirochaetales bacterium]|nr:ATP-binding cassette domain-containing protein [Spirochaetales bacterium]